MKDEEELFYTVLNFFTSFLSSEMQLFPSLVESSPFSLRIFIKYKSDPHEILTALRLINAR